MITIIVDTLDEYEEMKVNAIEYVCARTSLPECAKNSYDCSTCFDVFHNKYGIQLRINPVDNNNPGQL